MKDNIKTFGIFGQIFLLILSIVAFSYAIGSSVGEVNANYIITNTIQACTGVGGIIIPSIGGTSLGYTCSIPNPVTSVAVPPAPAAAPIPVNPPKYNPAQSDLSFGASGKQAPATGTTDSSIFTGSNPGGVPPPSPGGPPLCGGYPCPPSGGTSAAGQAAAGTSGAVQTGTYGLYTVNGQQVTGYLQPVNSNGIQTVTDINGKTLAQGPAAAIKAETWGGFFKEIGWNFLWALAIYQGLKYVLPQLGLNPGETKAASEAAGIGYLVGSSINSGFTFAGTNPFTTGINSFVGYGGWVGIGIGVAYYVNTYQNQYQKTATFTCSPWSPPVGGNDCDKCKGGILPCSEYQCRSLGQSCQLINQGTTDQKCVWINRNDVNPPVLKPWNDILTLGLSYTPDGSVLPPDSGVKVVNNSRTDGCIQAFTPFTIGVQIIGGGIPITNPEPAKCKIDTIRQNNYDNMSFFMSNGLAEYNHSLTLSLPSVSTNVSNNSITVQNNGNFSLHVRCQDSNGNSNVADFVFNYCVQKGPDTTPPLIVSTDIPTGLPIAFNQPFLNVNVYTNKPAQCSWSHNDRDYTLMEGVMNCPGNPNNLQLYACTANLTSLKNQFDNQFYFRCKDTSGNVNAQSYPYDVVGTQPLVISSAAPNNTLIQDSTNPVKVSFNVQTSAGYQNGNATCYYGNQDVNGNFPSDPTQIVNYIKFFNTTSFTHSQDLYLVPGNYSYDIKCVDLGGNADYKTLNFGVQSQTNPPIVVRVYHEDKYLKVITNENSSCVYDTRDCLYNFGDGINTTTPDNINHFIPWGTGGTFYVKCMDNFGNQPLPNQCSIIVSPSSF